MKKGLITAAVFLIALVPSIVGAQTKEIEEITDENLIVAQTTKYYKTITRYNNLALSMQSMNGESTPSSYTVEVTEEEYNNAPEEAIRDVVGEGSIETTYKKMTATISEDGSLYQYKNVLEWKTMPTVRSYDIIGIGYDSTVRMTLGLLYNLYYCTSDGSCSTNYIHVPQSFSNGCGASFKLPTGSLNTLKVTMYFDVTKNTTSTIYGLGAYGDYSHATTNVGSVASTNYSVGVGGIVLGSSISASYDYMDTADAYVYNLNW